MASHVINLSELASSSHSKPHVPKHRQHPEKEPEAQLVRYPREGHPEAPFFIITYPGMAEKFRADPSISILDVVEYMKVFAGTERGNGDIPPRGELNSEFGTDNINEVIRKILIHGKIVKAGNSDKWSVNT